MSLHVSAGKEAVFHKIRSTKAHRVVKKCAGNKLILEEDKILIVWNTNTATLTISNVVWLDWVSLSISYSEMRRKKEMDF